MSYPRLSIEEFGRHLITSGDLDPVYIALHKCAMQDTKLSRWLIAYWCMYHVGAACWLAEQSGPAFWDALEVAARNEQPAPTGGRWPRGSERRHWRGGQALASVAFLRARAKGPHELISELISEPPVEEFGVPFTFHRISQRVQQWRAFGPWIGFKVADMVDRVLGIQVTFDQAAVFMFKDPEKAAMMLWEQREGSKYPEGAKPKREVILTRVTEYLIDHFKDLQAPPLFDRPVNIQEIETVLCKWKSHMNGHYPLLNDIHEIREGLEEWLPYSDTAKRFLACMPAGE